MALMAPADSIIPFTQDLPDTATTVLPICLPAESPVAAAPLQGLPLQEAGPITAPATTLPEVEAHHLLPIQEALTAEVRQGPAQRSAARTPVHTTTILPTEVLLTRAGLRAAPASVQAVPAAQPAVPIHAAMAVAP